MANITTVTEAKVLKLKASQFSFMDCPRCLYLEAVHGIGKPSGPGSFGELMRQKSEQYKFLEDKKLSILGDDMPKGKILMTGKRPSTAPMMIEGETVVLSGQYDMLIECENGEFVLAAFKNSNPTNNLGEYAKQLNALAWILQNHKKEPEQKKISKLGIFWFNPSAAAAGGDYTEIYTWFNIPLNSEEFEAKLKDTVKMLASEPEAGIDDDGKICGYCKRDLEILSLYKTEK